METLTTRRHDLDALRACAMLLGIAIHASTAYGFDWQVVDKSQSKFFSWFFYCVHGFRMQIFFLVSGYFTAMLYKKRGLKQLINNRFKRIFLPLIIFLPIIGPLIEKILSLARLSQSGDKLQLSDSDLSWIEGINFHHLWFLWFLCLFVIIFVILITIPWPKISHKWINTQMCLIWLIPISLYIQSFANRNYPIFGPETSLGVIPIFSVFFYYAVFYYFGTILYYYDALSLTRRWKMNLFLSLFILFPIGMLIEWGNFYRWPNLVWLSDLLQVTFSWLMVFGCMGYFRHYFAKPSPTMRYLSEASYWLYLIHLPLVFGMQLVIRDWQVSCWLKFPLVNLSVFSILLCSYHFLVKDTILGRFLGIKRNANKVIVAS